ncbi:hypothetical protein P8935_07050 [Telmatobacter sp. DSM 110680]|uniref:PilZ domain-containing protein n=1 Tax=Telmatobacter sp. DSM 110680 TaxID=3036704 RepID=A0AAU7DP74_9BACT
MDTRVFCVYNVARGAFLSSKVTVADGENQPLTILKVLVGGLAVDSKSGLWLSPLHAIPSVPRLFPFDLFYLDDELRVVGLIEFVPGAEFPPYRREVTSALILPTQSLQSTQTELGDHLLICPAEEMERQISVLRSSLPVPASPFAGAHPGQSVPPRSEPALNVGSALRQAPSVRASAAVAVAEELSQSTMTVPSPGLSLANEQVSTSAMKAADLHADVATPAPQPEKIDRAGVSKDAAEVSKDVMAAIGTKPIAKVAVAEERTNVRSAGKASNGKPQVDPPVISITEVILERPRTVEPPTIVGGHGEVLHGDVEDLFSNWMDAPTLASTWKERSEPLRQLLKSAIAHPVVDTPITEPNAAVASQDVVPALPAISQAAVVLPDVKSESASSASSIAQVEQVEIDTQIKPAEMDVKAEPDLRPLPSPQANAESVKAETQHAAPLNAAPESFKVEPEFSKTGSLPVEPPSISTPVRVSLPQPAQASTSTVAQYGLWRASMPTAVLPVSPMTEPAKDTARTVPGGASTELSKTAGNPPSGRISKASPASSATDSPVSAAPASPAEADVQRSVQPFSRSSADLERLPRKPLVEAAKSRPEKTTEAVSRRPLIPDNFLSADEKRKPVNRVAASATSNKSAAEVPVQPYIEPIQDTQTASTADALAADAVDAVQRKLGIGQAAPESTKSVDRAEPEPVQKASAEFMEPARVAATDLMIGNDSLHRSHGELSLPETDTGAHNETAKAPARHVKLNGQAPAAARTFAERFKRWLNPTAPAHSDRRRAHRRYVPGMVAHYYTGGAPKPHDIADISMTGFYLLTEDRWMPDTMIQMTLQKPCAKGERKQSITVLSRIVRRGSDGVAAQFVMPETLDPHSHDVQPSQTTDKFALARFI